MRHAIHQKPNPQIQLYYTVYTHAVVIPASWPQPAPAAWRIIAHKYTPPQTHSSASRISAHPHRTWQMAHGPDISVIRSPAAEHGAGRVRRPHLERPYTDRARGRTHRRLSPLCRRSMRIPTCKTRASPIRTRSSCARPRDGVKPRAGRHVHTLSTVHPLCTKPAGGACGRAV